MQSENSRQIGPKPVLLTVSQLSKKRIKTISFSVNRLFFFLPFHPTRESNKHTEIPGYDNKYLSWVYGVDNKYLSWVYGVDRKICHEGH